MYEKLKKELKQVRGHDEVQWVDTFIAASIAKLVAAGITYPHEVLRTRLRQSPMKDGSHIYTSLGQATKLIYKQEGIRAFYGGMAAHLMRVVPNAAIMFFCYEFIVKTFSWEMMGIFFFGLPCLFVVKFKPPHPIYRMHFLMNFFHEMLSISSQMMDPDVLDLL